MLSFSGFIGLDFRDENLLYDEAMRTYHRETIRQMHIARSAMIKDDSFSEAIKRVEAHISSLGQNSKEAIKANWEYLKRRGGR